MKQIVAVALSIFIVTSCKKSSVIQGNNFHVYETEQGYPAKLKPSATGNVLIVENADLYPDILGIVAGMANSGMTNGKLDWVKDMQISELKLNEETYIRVSGASGFGSNITNSNLIYSYYPTDNSGEKKITIASYGGYDSSNGRIKYTISGENVTELFKTNPGGKLYFNFSFNNNASDYVYMDYHIAFSYDFAYSTMASKK